MSRLFSSNNKKRIIFLIIFLLFFNILNVSIIAGGDDRPDLIIESIVIPQKFYEGKDLEFVMMIKNQGAKNVTKGTQIGVALKIDGIIIAVNSSSNGLEPGSSMYINLTWTPSLDDIGKHKARWEVDYTDSIIEEDENNNIHDANIEVFEHETELEIISITPQDDYIVNQNVNILATVRNNGKSTTRPIFAKLNSSEDGQIEVVIKDDGLKRNGTFDFSFNWTPTHIGSQRINVEVAHGGKTHDFKEESIVVGFKQIGWWNVSWHYRYFLMVSGSGNISLFFNFTEMLKDLGVDGKTFENDTIRIIEYTKTGSVIKEVQIYKFIEGTGFDPILNATGTLIWNITGSGEKYYCVYFDVESNKGSRTKLDEAENIVKSGNNSVGVYDLTEGWWLEVYEPIDNGYTIIDESIDFNVTSVALAKEVKVYIYKTENEAHNFTINLIGTDYTEWKFENFYFDEEGNWTIVITGRDWTDYASIVELSFFVGKPDLKITDITFSTDWSYTSPAIYKNDLANFTGHVFSKDATIENVNVSIKVYNLGNKKLYYANFVITTIFKDKDNLISFNWNANESGKYNVTFRIDPNNVIDEQNESNNRCTENFTVLDWPDLVVKDIKLPTDEIIEFDPVEIKVDIANIGDGNAKDYEIRLYIEPTTQGVMTYTNDVDSSIFSADKGTTGTIDLKWDSAQPGEWLVAAQILRNDTKRDINKDNNQLLSNKTLTVIGIERNGPSIDNIKISPTSQQQGGAVVITADITDASGIKSVSIQITDPSDFTYNDIMIRTTGKQFKFTFDDTDKIGTYKYKIKAVDLSLHSNIGIKNGNFLIYEDEEPPVVSYFEAEPKVQLIGKKVNIVCIVADNREVDNVKVTITHPTASSKSKTEKEMSWSSSGKYVHGDDYGIPGKYTFYIEAEDEAGNTYITETKTFWITSNLDDTDNDGMTDEWEKQFKLDPYSPTDANDDDDNDGLTNKKEFEAGNNPQKNIFAENAVYRLKENALYLVGSIALFFLILVIIIIGRWRRLI